MALTLIPRTGQTLRQRRWGMKPPVVFFWLFIYAFAVSAWRCCSSCSVSAVVTNVLLGIAWTDQYLLRLEAPMSSRTVFLALRKNLTESAILLGFGFLGVGVRFWVRGIQPSSSLCKCGNPASFAGFPSAGGTVEKSGVGLFHGFPSASFPQRTHSFAHVGSQL